MNSSVKRDLPLAAQSKGEVNFSYLGLPAEAETCAIPIEDDPHGLRFVDFEQNAEGIALLEGHSIAFAFYTVVTLEHFF